MTERRLDDNWEWTWRHRPQWPGLTAGTGEARELVSAFSKGLAVFEYKQRMTCLWVSLLGGTGTGKSTLFNALCKSVLSQTGVERPKTYGPLAYTPKGCPVEDGFPFPSLQLVRKSAPSPLTGEPEALVIIEHESGKGPAAVIADTPDLDSVEARNREIARDFSLLADVVLFVSSQEKYADEVPHRFLISALKEKASLFFLLNKAHENLTRDEVSRVLKNQGVSLDPERVWILPFVRTQKEAEFREHGTFRALVDTLEERVLVSREAEKLRNEQLARLARGLIDQSERLLSFLRQEVEAGDAWIQRLDGIYEQASQELLEAERNRFKSDTRQYLGKEIRRLFSRYDPLAKPRRYIRELVLSPLRFLGIRRSREPGSKREALWAARRKTDLSSIQWSLEKFNRRVLESLSPEDGDSPLSRSLHGPGVVLSESEVKEQLAEGKKRMAEWLESRFERLSQGIPRTKKWGIYSTSLLWGILLVTFETALGGGFTALDAAIDSALAPFVTKGAADLFAYNEIRTIAGELSKRYQAYLLSVLDRQRRLYRETLEDLMPTGESLEELERTRERLEHTLSNRRKAKG